MNIHSENTTSTFAPQRYSAHQHSSYTAPKEDHVFESVKRNIQKNSVRKDSETLYNEVCRLRFIPKPIPLTRDNKEIFDMLKELHILKRSVPESLKFFRISCNKRVHTGVGYVNTNGGVHFYSSSIKKIALIGKQGYTFLRNYDNRKCDQLFVFENFLDYLVFRSLMETEFKRLYYDVLLMNSSQNFIASSKKIAEYKKVCLFFHTDNNTSLTMTLTLTKVYPEKINDMSALYTDSGVSSLMELYNKNDEKK